MEVASPNYSSLAKVWLNLFPVNVILSLTAVLELYMEHYIAILQGRRGGGGIGGNEMNKR